jgi:Lipocalin-like domain
MKHSALIVSVVSAAVVGFGLFAHAQKADKTLGEQLVGTWTLASVEDIYGDGHKENNWGPDMRGMVTFDGHGHYTSLIIGGDLPDVGIHQPPISQRAIAASFGTYTVDEAAKTVTYTAERATFRAWDNLPRKASMTINGPDELKQVSAQVEGPRGKFNPNIVWKRAD